jgi:hypothetical protein
MFLIATLHLDQSNYLPNQKQGAVDKHDLTMYISSSRSHTNNRGDLPEPWVLDVSHEHGYQLGYPE